MKDRNASFPIGLVRESEIPITDNSTAQNPETYIDEEGVELYLTQPIFPFSENLRRLLNSLPDFRKPLSQILSKVGSE